MAEWYLQCDHCGNVYDDKESIDMVKKEAKTWAEVLRKAGRSPKGLYPCPNLNCEGELHIKHT